MTDTSTGDTVDTTETTDDTALPTGTDGVADNAAKNDPEKNKKRAEIEIMESFRKQYKLTFEMPHVFKGLHTNRFSYIELNDRFYEKNYAEIVEVIKDTKYARYAGFEKGRFFNDRLQYGGGVSKGAWTKLEVNPLANNYGTYMKAQQDAEKQLISAMSSGTSSGGGGGLVNANGDDCGADISTWAPRSNSASAMEKASQKIIGNSNANYARDTANMTAEQAIKSINQSYCGYEDNHRCPQDLWKKHPNICCNCADFARLVKCICDVHGQKCGIYHASGHYFNYVFINGKWESIDLCTTRNNRWRGGALRNTAGWQ